MRRYPTYADDDVRYGLSSLVGAIERAAREVHRRFPDAVLSVGHLSRRGGGEVDRHASHESGRDADVGFYVKGLTGKPLLGERMVAFQGDGTASSWPGAHFDDARNWAFVAALLGDGHVRVSHLFIASPLRARLLAFAARSGASMGLRTHAAEVLMQPHGSLPHDDHFHVRISCPPGMTGCIEYPTRPKRRKMEPARGKSGAAGAGQGQAHSKPPTTELTPAPRARARVTRSRRRTRRTSTRRRRRSTWSFRARSRSRRPPSRRRGRRPRPSCHRETWTTWTGCWSKSGSRCVSPRPRAPSSATRAGRWCRRPRDTRPMRRRRGPGPRVVRRSTRDHD